MEGPSAPQSPAMPLRARVRSYLNCVIFGSAFASEDVLLSVNYSSVAFSVLDRFSRTADFRRGVCLRLRIVSNMARALWFNLPMHDVALWLLL